MEKTATITRTVFKNEYTGQHGKVFYHDVELDNGDKGSIGAKDKEPEKLNPGKTITYIIEATDKGNKIKLVNAAQQQFNNGAKKSNYQPTDPRIQNIGFAMAYSKDLAVGDKIKITEIVEYFERIYSAMDKKYLQIKGEQPKSEEPKQEEKKTEEKSTTEQHKRAENILAEGTLFSKEERKQSLDAIKAATKEAAERLISKINKESDNRKNVLAEEQESDLPF